MEQCFKWNLIFKFSLSDFLQRIHQLAHDWLLLLPWSLSTLPSIKVIIMLHLLKTFIFNILFFWHFSPLITSLVPAGIPKTKYHILFTETDDEKTESVIDYKFTSHDVVCLLCCTVLGICYLYKKVKIQSLVVTNLWNNLVKLFHAAKFLSFRF